MANYNMIQDVPPEARFPVPADSKFSCLANPGNHDDCTSFPIIVCCQNTYWAYSYIDNRLAMNICAYDPVGNLVQQWEQKGARYLWKLKADMEAKSVTFTGQSEKSIVMTFDTLGLMEYKATKDDLLKVAAFYSLPLTDADAQSLADALPTFDCSNCSGEAQAPRKREIAGWTVGGAIGALVGGAVGAVIGGPAGAAAGAAVGFNLGAGIGLTVEPPPPPQPYEPGSSASRTYVYIRDYPVGPFANGSAWEDIIDWEFPRYGEIETAGALTAPSAGNKAMAWYPKKNQFLAPWYTYTPIGTITKYIFVVVQVAGESKDGAPAYQMRIHPEHFYPDTLRADERINHSQLSEGGRFAALVGYPVMQVYGAGTLYIDGGTIQGMDSRTGHYYWALDGKDAEMLAAAQSVLRALGYNTSGIRTGRDLTTWLQEAMY